MPIHLRRLLYAVLLSFLPALPVSGQGIDTGRADFTPPHAGDGFHPILVDTAGEGPGKGVAAFRLNPAIRDDVAARGRFASHRAMQAIREGFIAHQDARADQLFRDAAWDQFSDAFGIAGEVLTQAENVGQLSLTNINNVMTELGLFMTVWQVSLDLSRGDDRAAGVNAFRGMMNYAMGKYAWPALKLASPALLIINHSLTSFGREAWLARTDAWRQAYTGYYAEMDAQAEAAQWGAQRDHLPQTDAERLREIRMRVEGGRSRNEWALFLYHAYQHASTPERFMYIVEAELRNYVSRFWDSPQFELYARDPESARGMWGVAAGTSLTQEIREKLEDEHRAALMTMFVEDILPDIVHRAWIEATEEKVEQLNAELRPALNEPIEIAVSALDIEGETRFTIPLPAGGEWRGVLAPGQDRVLQVRKYAWLASGAPNRIILHRPEGPEEQRIFFEQTDRAAVTFGQAVASVVSHYAVREDDQRCDHVFAGPSAPAPYSDTRPARPEWRLSFSVAAPAGNVLLGRYDDSQGWQQASTGRAEGEGLTLAAPYHDDIARLDSCTGGFLQRGMLAEAQCTLTRQSMSSTDGVQQRSTCRSRATLSITGVHILTGEDAQFYDLTGPQGRAMRDALLQAFDQMDQYMNGGGLSPGSAGGAR